MLQKQDHLFSGYNGLPRKQTVLDRVIRSIRRKVSDSIGEQGEHEQLGEECADTTSESWTNFLFKRAFHGGVNSKVTSSVSGECMHSTIMDQTGIV